MLSSVRSIVAVTKQLSSKNRIVAAQSMNFGTTDKKGSILDAWNASCYHEMNFSIPETATVFEAVERLAAYDVGALVTTDENGNLSGIISERDYVKKVALLGRASRDTKIKDIFTQKRNLVKASLDDSVEEAMNKMMTKSIRHLPIVDGDKLVGIVSIKDLIKAVVEDRNKQIKDLSEIALGKTSY